MRLNKLTILILISFFALINVKSFGCSCRPIHGFIGYIDEKTIVVKGEIVDVIYGDSIYGADFPKEISLRILDGFGTINDIDTIKLISGQPGDCSIVFENYKIGEKYYFIISPFLIDSHGNDSNNFWVSSCGASELRISNDLIVANGLVRYKRLFGLTILRKLEIEVANLDKWIIKRTK